MFPRIVHRYFFLFGVFSLAFGMMIGAVPTSVPQFVLLINWIIEGEYKRKWQTLKSSKLFWILEIVFLIHVLGLFYTADMKAGVADIQIKLPLMILPLVLLSTEPLSLKDIRITLFSFLLGCVCNTLWCLAYSFMMHHHEVVRNTSRFMSHIRLGLYLNMAIVVSLYLAREISNLKCKTGLIILAFYFLLVMYLLGLASGIAILFVLMIAGAIVSIFKKNWVWKLSAFLLIFSTSFLLLNFIKTIKDEQFTIVKAANNRPLDKSVSGNSYIHFDTTGFKENGYFILINIQLDELKRSWQRRSPADSFSFPPHPFNLNRYNVLTRYMASKGLNKDSVGVSQLNETDIINVRNGVTNYKFNSWNYLHQRTYELVNEYDSFVSERNINGQSITMRFYFWKAAFFSIRENPVLGVGTGDVQNQLNKIYESTNSPLDKEWYKRPHNQFLTIIVSLGFLGVILVLISLFYPVIVLRKNLNVLYFAFMVVYLISFMAEDTIETQAGATFFAFFNTFLITCAYFKKQQNPVD